MAKSIPVGKAPAGLAITPSGKTLYVANYYSGTISTIGKPVSLAAGAGQLAAMPARLTISTRSLKAGKTRKWYRDQLVAAGGVGAYSWKVSAGKLPKGLKLSKSGLISGKPAKKETVSFTARLTDPSGVTATEKLKIT